MEHENYVHRIYGVPLASRIQPTHIISIMFSNNGDTIEAFCVHPASPYESSGFEKRLLAYILSGRYDDSMIGNNGDNPEHRFSGRINPGWSSRHRKERRATRWYRNT